MKNIGIVLGVYDGLCSHYCGVGTMARDFVLSFKDVIQGMNKNNHFELLPVCVKNTEFALSEETKNEINQQINMYSSVYKAIKWIDNGSNGEDPYGNVSNWMILCNNLTEYLERMSYEYDIIIFIGFDGPYLGSARMFNEKYKSIINVFFVNIFYSSVLYNRSLPFSKVSNYSRLGWEFSAVSFARGNSDKSILYANGESFAEIVSSYYNIDRLPYVNNGLFFERLNKISSQDEISNYLIKYGIPLEKKLMFTVGRCEKVKGFEYVIYLAKILSEINIHTVMLISQCDQNPNYYEQIKELTRVKYITLIDKRDMILPGLLYQWRNTMIAAELAEKETAGLLPAESRYYGNCIAVVSNVEGLAEQIEDGVDGLITGITVDEIESIGKKIINMTDKEIECMRKKGRDKVLSKYNSIENYRRFLNNILDGIDY